MWNFGSVFPLLIVTSGGKFTGLFVYSGNVPATGNLIASITAQAGTDPYSNHFDAGITSYDNTFGGVTEISGAQITIFSGTTKRAILNPGHFTVFNSHGATIYDVDLARAAQFLYADTGSVTQGALVASEAQASGTDQFGNSYVAGLGTYSSPAISQVFNGLFSVGRAVQFAGTGGASPGSVGLNTNNVGTLALLSGAASNTDVQAVFVLNSATASGASNQSYIEAGSPLVLAPILTPVNVAIGAVLWGDSSGYPRAQVNNAGDTNNYFLAYTSTGATGLPQTISSTTPTTISNLHLPVGIGQYAFRARVVYQGGAAAGTASFSVSGPANTSPSINAMFVTDTGVAGTGVQNAALGPVISPTLTVGNSVADISGEVTFTAAGTIALQCAEGVGGDTVLIEQARFWLYPIL